MPVGGTATDQDAVFMSQTAAGPSASTDRENLSPGEYVDGDHPAICAFAKARVAQAQTSEEQARALYRAVRDEIRYDPYVDYTDLETYRAAACCNGDAATADGGLSPSR